MSVKIYIDNTERFRDEDEFYEAYSLMPEFRKKKIDSIIFPEKKRASLTAGLLLKRGLFDAGIDDIEVYSDITRFAYPIGKAASHYDIDTEKVPYRPGDDIYFSLSHSGHFAMCITGNEVTGCDIEEISDRDVRLAEKILSADQLAKYREMEREEQQKLFFTVWTVKESVMKAEGKGIFQSSEDIETAMEKYTAQTFCEIPGYVYSYVTRRSGL